MKFDLEELVVIKENGEVGLIIDREIEDDELLYVVAYLLDGQSFCEEFYENELEKFADSIKIYEWLLELYQKLLKYIWLYNASTYCTKETLKDLEQKIKKTQKEIENELLCYNIKGESK